MYKNTIIILPVLYVCETWSLVLSEEHNPHYRCLTTGWLGEYLDLGTGSNRRMEKITQFETT
jgi:hypothetical protein